MENLDQVLLYAVPFFVVMVLLELGYSAWRRLPVYETRDALASLSMGLGNLAIGLWWKAVALGIYYAVYQFRLFELSPAVWWVWLALLFADDFCYYWFHRFSHRVRMGWAGHVNHHSSERYNLTTALRQSWTSMFFGPMFWAPLALIGFHPLMIIGMQSLNLIYQFWIHTETIKRLGPLEWVMNTPSHHRVHHGSNPQYIDRNYAGIFIIWDRMFGTFEPENEPVKYGLTKNIGTYNPLRIAFHEWRDMLADVVRAHGLRARLGHLLMPPGWESRKD